MLNLNKVILSFCFVLSLQAAAGQERAGHGSSGGGSARQSLVADFILISAEVGNWLIQNPGILPVSGEEFLSAIDPKTIKPTLDPLVYRTEAVDAYYCAGVDSVQCPQADIIRVNESGWDKIQSKERRWKLVSHEIFRRLYAQGKKHAYDEDYELSGRIVAKAFGNLNELLRRLSLVQNQDFDSVNDRVCGYHVEVERFVSPPQLNITTISRHEQGKVVPCWDSGSHTLTCDAATMICSTRNYYSGTNGPFRYEVRLLEDGSFVSTIYGTRPSSIKWRMRY